jgi:histidinol dehydrogenase
MDKRENNKKILASLRDDDANRDHIFKRCWDRIQAMRQVTTVLKRSREDEQKALTNIELYLDDWAFHRGPITKDNVKEAMTDVVDRVLKQHQAKQQRVEDAEFHVMQGPLAEFADFNTPLGDLPGDGEIADALCKADPELKKYRKNLV